MSAGSTLRNAGEIVALCENVLGWSPPGRMPLSKARRHYAERLQEEIARDPERLCRRNLELTIELLRRRRQTVRSPLYLLHRVDEALELANPAAPSRPLGELIDAAIAAEMADPSPRSAFWTGRLFRASGPARAEVYAEWLAERVRP